MDLWRVHGDVPRARREKYIYDNLYTIIIIPFLVHRGAPNTGLWVNHPSRTRGPFLGESTT